LPGLSKPDVCKPSDEFRYWVHDQAS